jgi:hypothetical protein
LVWKLQPLPQAQRRNPPAATIGPSPHGRSRTAQRERSCLRQLMSLGSEMGVWDAMGCYGMLWDAMGCYGMGVLVAIVLHRKGLMDDGCLAKVGSM